MEYDIHDLKKIRRQLGMTQSELASRAGVSQSLIAKVESGSIDPSYSHARKIFDALSHISMPHEKKVSDIMQSRIISLRPGSSVKEAVALMKKHAISQLPVISKGIMIGLITENKLLDIAGEEHKAVVKDFMDESPPTVAPNASLPIVLSLLKFYPMVAVVSEGRLAGIVTKSDVISKLY